MAAPSCFFASVVSAWWFSAMLVTAARGAEEESGGCSATKCGDLNISSPFWITQKQASRPCGILDFQVDCNDTTGVATLRTFSSSQYWFEIKSISYEERALVVVDVHKLGDFTNATNCHVPTWNTSVKLGLPFTISPGNLNLVFYNCSAKAQAAAEWREMGLVETRCRNNSFALLGGRYDHGGNLDEYYLEGCNTTIMPAFVKAGSKANASAYEELMRGGFLMTWDLTSATGKQGGGQELE